MSLLFEIGAIWLTAVLKFVTILTFRNLASYIQDGRKITL
jgi:hypothetical protein